MATPTALTHGRRSATPSEPERLDEWDQLDRLTRRIGRWALVGIPSWLVLLAAFNQQLTGIPWLVGVVAASVLATIIVVLADRRAQEHHGSGLGPVARSILTWGVAFGVFAIVFSAAGAGDSVLILVPFVAATFVTAAIEIARRAMAGRR